MLRETPLSFLENRRLAGNHTTIALTPTESPQWYWYVVRRLQHTIGQKEKEARKSDESEEEKKPNSTRLPCKKLAL